MGIPVMSPAWLSRAGRRRAGAGQTPNLGIKIGEHLTGFLLLRTTVKAQWQVTQDKDGL